ncbi:MAG: QueT transporter family protein [Erysipelotrichaceae bacterium]|nr:QueT transporter family protein [Erysipelotrichaceae bacterium]
MNNSKTIARVAMIAALYTALSLALAPFSFGNIQVRIAEGLTLLPLIWQPGIPAVTLGCFLTNLIGAMMGVNVLGFVDCFVGTMATFLAAVCTRKLRDVKVGNIPVLSILMPVLFNAIIIGGELAFAFYPGDALVTGWIISALEVGAGELISVIIGYIIINVLDKKGVFNKFKD